jgi:hypothetical protein
VKGRSKAGQRKDIWLRFGVWLEFELVADTAFTFEQRGYFAQFGRAAKSPMSTAALTQSRSSFSG